MSVFHTLTVPSHCHCTHQHLFFTIQKSRLRLDVDDEKCVYGSDITFFCVFLPSAQVYDNTYGWVVERFVCFEVQRAHVIERTTQCSNVRAYVCVFLCVWFALVCWKTSWKHHTKYHNHAADVSVMHWNLFHMLSHKDLTLFVARAMTLWNPKTLYCLAIVKRYDRLRQIYGDWMLGVLP